MGSALSAVSTASTVADGAYATAQSGIVTAAEISNSAAVAKNQADLSFAEAVESIAKSGASAVSKAATPSG